MQKQIATGILAGALAIGGVGAALISTTMVAAADPTASPSATATTTPPGTSGGTSGGTGTTPGLTPRGMHGGPGGLDADDLTAAAKALGMTEADLTTALQSGKTTAQVATDEGVELQKVIDAIVASDTAEFDAAVKAGTMTQAQADQLKANLAQHVTDEVNGVMGGHGFGPQEPVATPAPSGSTGSGTSG